VAANHNKEKGKAPPNLRAAGCKWSPLRKVISGQLNPIIDLYGKSCMMRNSERLWGFDIGPARPFSDVPE
jgi:hypothetical protein